MDARTDSYLSAKKLAQDGAVEFDPKRELLPTELIWVLDELFRLQVSIVLEFIILLKLIHQHR